MFTIMDDDGEVTNIKKLSPGYIYAHPGYLQWKFEA